MARWFIDKNGYRRFSDSGKLVHRRVAEKKIGRELHAGEVVHHINRDKRDNSCDNLWVFTGRDGQKKHTNTHRNDKRKFGFW